MKNKIWTLTFNNIKILLDSIEFKKYEFCRKYFLAYSSAIKQAPARTWVVKESDNIKKARKPWKINATKRVVTISKKNDVGLFLMRVIRSLVILEDINNGKIIFKGSCINKNGEGFAIIGPRRSGKTSIITSLLLRNTSIEFLSNSIFAIKKTATNALVFGYPMAMGLRKKVIHSLFNKGNVEFKRILNKLAETIKRDDDDRYYITPPQFKQYFGNKILNLTRLKYIIILRSIPSNSSANIKKISKKTAYETLQKYAIQPCVNNVNQRCSPWYKLFRAQDKISKNIIADLTNNVACYKVEYNIASHSNVVNFLEQI